MGKKKELHFNAKYDWNKINPVIVALARLGMAEKRIAKALDIPHSTIRSHLESDKELMAEVRQANARFFNYLLDKMLAKVERGYYPAIEYLFDKVLTKIENITLDENQIETLRVRFELVDNAKND